MSIGMRFRGTHGVFQIDEKYRNVFLRANGTTSISGNPQGLGSITTVTVSGGLSGTESIALSGTQAAAVVGRDSTGFTVYTVDTSGSFNWWVFDRLTAISTSGFGVAFRNPTTLEPIYDSTQKPLVVLGNHQAPSPGTGSGLHGSSVGLIPTATYSGKIIGWINMHLASSLWSGPSGGPGAVPNYYYVLCPRASTGSLNAQAGRFTSFNGSPDVNQSNSGRVMAIDLTNY